MKCQTLLVLLVGLGWGMPARAEFPRESIAEIPNGVSAPFTGRWSMGFPEGDGMINGEPLASCEQPVEIRANGEQAIVYVSSGGREVAFDLAAFSGRTSWFPPAGDSIVAVWTSQDEFFSYSVDPASGRARWEDPRVYRRCP